MATHTVHTLVNVPASPSLWVTEAKNACWQVVTVGNSRRETTSINPRLGLLSTDAGRVRAGLHRGAEPGPPNRALARAGVTRENIHVDHASGAKASRPKLDLVLRILRDGDVLVVTRLVGSGVPCCTWSLWARSCVSVGSGCKWWSRASTPPPPRAVPCSGCSRCSPSCNENLSWPTPATGWRCAGPRPPRWTTPQTHPGSGRTGPAAL